LDIKYVIYRVNFVPHQNIFSTKNTNSILFDLKQFVEKNLLKKSVSVKKVLR